MHTLNVTAFHIVTLIAPQFTQVNVTVQMAR